MDLRWKYTVGKSNFDFPIAGKSNCNFHNMVQYMELNNSLIIHEENTKEMNCISDKDRLLMF